MAKKYDSNQFWQLYHKLPQELKDALFADETSESISKICERNGVEKNMGEITDCVGEVLLGLLSPDKFQDILKKELKIKNDKGKEIAHEINRFIFYPVKTSLEELYKMEIKPAAVSETASPPTIAGKPLTTPKKEISRKPESEAPKKPRKPDTYREPIE